MGRARWALVVASAVAVLVAFGVLVARQLTRSSADIAAEHARQAARAVQVRLDSEVPRVGTPEQLTAAVRVAASGAVVRSVRASDVVVVAVVQITETGNSATLSVPNPSATATLCFEFSRDVDAPTFSYAELSSCP